MCTLPQAEESEESEEEHEETEEEFLERYAKTARELQEEAVEEAENGQDEDGHEIELGTSPHILLKLSCCYFLSLSPSSAQCCFLPASYKSHVWWVCSFFLLPESYGNT